MSLATPTAKPGKLTPKQVRAIRLSMAFPRDLAPIYGLESRSIQAIRAGINYGKLKKDEREAHRARQARDINLSPPPRETLCVGLTFPVLGRPDLAARFDLLAALDASGECFHGRLPSDRTVPCGCWPDLEAELVVLPVEQLTLHEHERFRVTRYRLIPCRGTRNRPTHVWGDLNMARAAARGIAVELAMAVLVAEAPLDGIVRHLFRGPWS